jgi:transposase-like protein
VIWRGKATLKEWAPLAGQIVDNELTRQAGLSKDESMASHRTHSIEFKRQVAQEFLAGETPHGLSKPHDICRNLIRVWVRKYEAGAFNEDVETADLLQRYEARIAALELLVGKQASALGSTTADQFGRPPARRWANAHSQAKPDA